MCKHSCSLDHKPREWKRGREWEKTSYTSACEPVFEVFEKDSPRLDGIENEERKLYCLSIGKKAQHENEGRHL